MTEEVKQFINKFYSYGNDKGGVIDLFTNGCCYWFAYILESRFRFDNADIVYDQVSNHFGTKIGDRVYDITGDVTDKYDWESWRELDDDLLKSRVIRDCIV